MDDTICSSLKESQVEVRAGKGKKKGGSITCSTRVANCYTQAQMKKWHER